MALARSMSALRNASKRQLRNGTLPAGTKLPPQRDLAFDIGVTIGTVGRAYALVRERGLVSGEVGRGTFVLGREADQQIAPVAAPWRSARRACPCPARQAAHGQHVGARRRPERDHRKADAEILRDASRRGGRLHPRMAGSWQEAGSRWLKSGNWTPDPSSIVSTIGAHAAVLGVIAAMTAPGDKIAYEELTYSSISRSANLIGRRSVLIGSDDDGADPEDFERLCAQQHPKIAFLMPSLQNPTLAIMPLERRKAIVEIARKYNVWLIEDAIYGELLTEQPPTFAELAPERTFHVGGLSKTVAAGVRGGWVSCPANFAPRVLTAHKMITGGIPFLLGELASELVLSGRSRRDPRPTCAARSRGAKRSRARALPASTSSRTAWRRSCG